MSTIIGLADVSKISKYSFTTYLYHMPFVGILARVYNLNAITMAFAPIIIYLIVNFILWIIDFASEKLKIDKLYKLVLGIR